MEKELSMSKKVVTLLSSGEKRKKGETPKDVDPDKKMKKTPPPSSHRSHSNHNANTKHTTATATATTTTTTTTPTTATATATATTTETTSAISSLSNQQQTKSAVDTNDYTRSAIAELAEPVLPSGSGRGLLDRLKVVMNTPIPNNNNDPNTQQQAIIKEEEKAATEITESPVEKQNKLFNWTFLLFIGCLFLIAFLSDKLIFYQNNILSLETELKETTANTMRQQTERRIAAERTLAELNQQHAVAFNNKNKEHHSEVSVLLQEIKIMDEKHRTIKQQMEQSFGGQINAHLMASKDREDALQNKIHVLQNDVREWKEKYIIATGELVAFKASHGL